ncbi:MAG: AraC family transcriptional regulator [Chitinophagaceae bacterium]|nr:MAG: AraC family transcriptional regulator [Chitinophagaceae bacterium]
MTHTEFIHRAHFTHNYHRRHARKALSYFIDFFWETDFDTLLAQHAQGFSDALFPNVGYTYMLNLGTPFVMELDGTRYPVKQDIFLPRHLPMICHHQAGNRIFGIKFRVSPIVLEKNVNFSEYREAVHPLAYLIDKNVLKAAKGAANFEERVQLLSHYYGRIIDKHAGEREPVAIVTQLLRDAGERRDFSRGLAELASHHGISPRTLQRYFLATTSISGKQALQILRIRTAIELLVNRPNEFRYEDFGYYDYSHFLKHLKQFSSLSRQGGTQGEQTSLVPSLLKSLK